MRIIFFTLLAAVFASPASAQVCNFSSTGINFGTLTVSSAPNTSSTGNITATCTGTRNATINICANLGSGSGGNNATASRRYMTFGTEQIEYNLYQSNGVGQVWGSHVWPYPPRPPAWSVTLSGSGSATVQKTLFGRLYTALVSPGVFISNFSGGHTLFDYGYAPGFQCGAAVSSRAVRVPFTAQVNSLGDCELTTTPMDFGTLQTLDVPVNATNAVTLKCTRGVSYAIGFSNGTSGATNPAARRMKSAGTTDSVTYGIYTNAARTSPWGAATVSATGTGNTQTFTGYGQIPVQATPEVANYSDTVTVTVTY
jgi:spore coat protein U-like protein